MGEKKITGKPCDLSGLVDYTSKLSNLLEDYKKLDDFAQSVEYLLVKDENGKIVVKKEDRLF